MTSKTNISNPRNWIAKIICWTIPIATIILATIALIFSFIVIKYDHEKAIQILQYTFTAFLPLWGTWLGTVLAYYFSKDNFESANKQVQNLVAHVISESEKLQGTKVKDVWIPYNDRMIKINFKSNEDPMSYKVTDAITLLETNKQQRLPIFKDNILIFIIHLSIFDRYIRIQAIKKKDYSSHTIAEMLKSTDPSIENALKSGAGFIDENSNLLEAKQIMNSNTNCNDIFVTRNGIKNEEVLGWITDKIINENAKV